MALGGPNAVSSCFAARWTGASTSDTGGVGAFRARGRNITYSHFISGGVYNGTYRCAGLGCPAQRGNFHVRLGNVSPERTRGLDGYFSGPDPVPSCLFDHNVTGSLHSLDINARWTCYVYDGPGTTGPGGIIGDSPAALCRRDLYGVRVREEAEEPERVLSAVRECLPEVAFGSIRRRAAGTLRTASLSWLHPVASREHTMGT